MAGDCTHTNAPYTNSGTFCPSKPWSDGDRDRPGDMESVGDSRGRALPARLSPNFEVIDGLLYRKKLEKGFINYREVLDADRRHEAISTFHLRRHGQRHLSLEETYKCVAENYWWEGMYFQIRDFVLGCPECQSQQAEKTEKLCGRGCVTKTMASHSGDILGKLRSQREAGLFCDITLRTSGRSYSAHRAVLAAVSDHFQEIFTEMDLNAKADIDLTGFSEDSLLSLLDFSYSSTLCVRREDLPEVSAMARHLGMWPAVEACSALMKEQEQQHHLGKGFTSTCAGACHGRHHQQREGKRKKALGPESNMNDSFSLTLDASDESFERSPRRNLRRMAKSEGHNGLPLSPSHRMKLMDFKSPSSKKAAIPRHTVANLQSQNYTPIPPSNTRLLRSTPGAAKEVQRFLPKPESPRRNRKSHTISRHSRTSRSRPSSQCSPVRVKQEVEEVGEDEEDYARAQEKYKLMNVLGLQRTALLPRPEDLIGWRQKKRLRKLKANNYSLTKRRKPRSTSPVLPYADMTLSLPLCNPVNTRLLNKSVKAKPVGPVSAVQITAKKPKSRLRHIPPSDRSMRSKGVLPDMFQPASRASYGGRELRRSVRMGDVHLPAQQPLRRSTNKPLVRNTVRIKSEPTECSISGLSLSSSSCRGHPSQRSPPTLKTQARNQVTEPADPVPVGQFPDPPSPDLGKRQSKPPIKLLDSGFLFSFCRPVGGPMAGLKKEEESVDICLTRSVSQVGEKFGAEEPPHRALRARAPPTLPVVKREREERRVSQNRDQKPRGTSRNNTHRLAKSAGSKTTRTMPKQQGKLLTLSSRNCVMLDAVRRARLKQLRGPRSQAPKAPKAAAHACLQCPASYKDCDALIMHRLRHIEGKHWPCPVSTDLSK
ncbi:hypothetical protein INR49_005771 [Caranx melampygus]|nr:hypothetical protein INR49_005771 [Caranx melampygus]